jgi:hypothetical protein
MIGMERYEGEQVGLWESYILATDSVARSKREGLGGCDDDVNS